MDSLEFYETVALLDYTCPVKYLLQAKCFKKINSETSESKTYSKNTLICEGQCYS